MKYLYSIFPMKYLFIISLFLFSLPLIAAQNEAKIVVGADANNDIIVKMGVDISYCSTTGCIMQGDINMNGHNIINATWINATYMNVTNIVGNGSGLTGIIWAGLISPMSIWNSTQNDTYDANNISLTNYINSKPHPIIATTICGGTDKVSGIDNTTGIVTCTADETGGAGVDLSDYINTTKLDNNTIVRATNTTFLDWYATNRLSGYVNETQLATNLAFYVNLTILNNNLVNYINNTILGNNLVNYVNNSKFDTIGNWSADRPNYINSTIFNTIGNWTLDKTSYTATASLANSHTHNAINITSEYWVNETGDTMSGDLAMGGNDVTGVGQITSKYGQFGNSIFAPDATHPITISNGAGQGVYFNVGGDLANSMEIGYTGSRGQIVTWGYLLPFYFDAQNVVLQSQSGGRVQMGTTTDDGINRLQVTGDTKLTGNLNVTGNVNISKNVSANWFKGFLNFSGLQNIDHSVFSNTHTHNASNITSGTFNGNYTVTGNLTVTNNVSATKFTGMGTVKAVYYDQYDEAGWGACASYPTVTFTTDADDVVVCQANTCGVGGTTNSACVTMWIENSDNTALADSSECWTTYTYGAQSFGVSYANIPGAGTHTRRMDYSISGGSIYCQDMHTLTCTIYDGVVTTSFT